MHDIADCKGKKVSSSGLIKMMNNTLDEEISFGIGFTFDMCDNITLICMRLGGSRGCAVVVSIDEFQS